MATTYGRNIRDVEYYIGQKITYALKQTQNIIYNVIQDFIRQYYAEQVFYDENGSETNKPKIYERTFQFFNSLVKSEIKHKGNEYWCEVYIDPEQLDYYAHDGLEVLQMINSGYHAYIGMNNGVYNAPRNIYSQINFWDDSIDEFKRANYIINEFIYYLKRAGLKIV